MMEEMNIQMMEQGDWFVNDCERKILYPFLSNRASKTL